ncbi:hypothetical protein Tco_1445106, partial [Tanacetum coccineum]
MQLIQKLRDDKKCMKKVEPSSRPKVIEDIINIGSFVKALVLNHYVLVKKIFISPKRQEGIKKVEETSSRPKVIEDIINIGSFVKALVLNHYVLVKKI